MVTGHTRKVIDNSLYITNVREVIKDENVFNN